MAAKKTFCPVTRNEFREKAQPVEITINGQTFTADVKEFSTGSLGWYLNAKASITVGEKRVPVQIGLNLTIVGSKELPADAADAIPPAQQSRDNMNAEGPTQE
jgi:hypothetical protein